MTRWAESMLLWSWQSLLLILAIVVVVRVFRFRSAADRYAFWLIGVVAVAALPLANAFVKTLPPKTPSSFPATASFTAVGASFTELTVIVTVATLEFAAPSLAR